MGEKAGLKKPIYEILRKGGEGREREGGLDVRRRRMRGKTGGSVWVGRQGGMERGKKGGRER